MKRFVFIFVLFCCTCNCTPQIGAEYVGTKYINDPLGEGFGYDADPLIRFDAFDCTTFVETVLADGNEKKLNKIRYMDGKVDFLHRNHFIESDWLVSNSDIVKNISNLYGQTEIKRVKIDKAAWLKRVHNINSDFEPVWVDIEYLPYKNLKKIDIIAPLVVLFVADNSKKINRLGTDFAVVHMGFLLPGGIFRHASSEKKQVVDVLFEEYIASRCKNKENLGIILLGIKQ